jgi:ATP-dependent Clp protease adaptor protein ClpS
LQRELYRALAFFSRIVQTSAGPDPGRADDESTVTRRAKYKALYVAILAGGTIAVLGVGTVLMDRAGHMPRAAPLALVALGIAMLFPRRVPRFYWRDLIAGARLMKREDYAGSKIHFERFIAKVRRAPWLKNLLWLGTSSYSTDPEAMALNLLGIAEVCLGAFEAAQRHFEEAIALDPGNPLPHRGMADLRLRAGTSAEAISWIEKAAALGLRDDWGDRLMRATRPRFAFTDSGVVAVQPPLPEADLPPATGNYRVELLNDDKTSMQFVVELLEQVFDHSGAQAIRTMLAVHDQGSAVCGRYDEAEARTRMDSATARARAAGFPLSLRVSACPEIAS